MEKQAYGIKGKSTCPVVYCLGLFSVKNESLVRSSTGVVEKMRTRVCLFQISWAYNI